MEIVDLILIAVPQASGGRSPLRTISSISAMAPYDNRNGAVGRTCGRLLRQIVRCTIDAAVR